MTKASTDQAYFEVVPVHSGVGTYITELDTQVGLEKNVPKRQRLAGNVTCDDR